jgi:two-component system alkaline phosphatase synthesis response regulator PhoP
VSGGRVDAPRARLLLAEDEPSLVLTLTDRLRAEGYAVEPAGDGEAALTRAQSGAFDLLLLDVNLPRRDGFEVCRELRQRGFALPILMLTARGQVVDRVIGLKLGADDYLTKPFEHAELLARIEALLRRTRGELPRRIDSFAFGEVRVDFRSGEVTRDGQPVALAPRELELLHFFVAHRDEVLSRERLLDEVWGYEATVQSRTVDVHVLALRQKLEGDPARPRYLRTVHGRGYRFVP